MNPRSILIIDDEADIREVTALTLEAVGSYEVISAESGPAGIAAASMYQPSVILLDVMMPVLDGPATFALLQERDDTRVIPVIFMTAKAQDAADQRHLRDLGARGLITKPFDPMTLAIQIEEILGGSACTTPLEMVRLRFVSGLGRRVDQLSALIDQVDDREALEQAAQIFHTLIGLGRTCGYPMISTLASDGESICDRIRDGISPADMPALRSIVASIGEYAHVAS